MASGTYVNPIPKGITPERIDMGVDYAGSGNYLALGDGVVTQVNPGGWGQYGNYIEYQLTNGPDAGKYVYYAEGVTPHVRVGQKLSAGQIVASLIPGWHSGTEVGWGSGKTNTSYAAASGGGYSEGALTASGKSFSDLLHSLGAPAGLTEGRSVTGTAPSGAGAVSPGLVGAVGTGASASIQGGGGLNLNPLDAINSALNGLFNSVVHRAKYAAIALVAIVGGFVLLGKGLNRATHAQAPA